MSIYKYTHIHTYIFFLFFLNTNSMCFINYVFWHFLVKGAMYQCHGGNLSASFVTAHCNKSEDCISSFFLESL